MDFGVAGQTDGKLDGALALPQLGEGAFGDGGGGGCASKLAPAGATVPFPVGIDGDVQRHGAVIPGPS